MMPTIRPVNVAGFVTRTFMFWRANRRICRTDGQHVLVDRTVCFDVVQVPVMEVVDVAFMFDGSMTAVLAVLVIVVGMNVVGMAH